MRFSTIQSMLVAASALTRAQDLRCCAAKRMVDFEDLTEVPPLGLGLGASLVQNGYSNLNWANLYGVAPSLAAQFLLPQGKLFVVAPNFTATAPVVISAPGYETFTPASIFLGTFLRNILGVAGALTSPSIITVSATFVDERGQANVAFKFNPANTVFGLPINAEPLQHFRFPCDWTRVRSLSFRIQAENVPSDALGLAIDNFELIDDSKDEIYSLNCVS